MNLFLLTQFPGSPKAWLKNKSNFVGQTFPNVEEKRCMLLMEVGGPNVQFSQIYLLNTAAICGVWYNRGVEYNTNVLIPSGFYIFELV